MNPATMLPRGPVLDWASLSGPRLAGLPAVDDLPHQLPTTSGRAALFQALRALALPPGSAVLVPSYHCPTMVAPVVHAGLRPVFYGLDAYAAPRLEALDTAALAGVRALLVAHYFGRARSLATERRWCDERGMALIEDCAHCFFGQAGDRPVGAWGDFAIASLTKFLPVPEAGLLASARRPIGLTALPGQSARAQVKGLVDVLERAQQHQRLRGLGALLGVLFKLKNGRSPPSAGPVSEDSAAAQDPLQGCDLSRAGSAPVAVARLLQIGLPRARVVQRRQAHQAHLRQRLAGQAGLHLPFDLSSVACAPYVLPVWVDDADRVYGGLRRQGWPVFRWDRRWPGQPVLPGDHGDTMGHHLLQLPCHQDFGDGEVEQLADALLAQVRGRP